MTEIEQLREFVAAYDAWQVGKAQADLDEDWLRIAPLYDAMVEARARIGMSYTITHRDRFPLPGSSAPFGRLHSRHTVATLDEARDECLRIAGKDGNADLNVSLPDANGSMTIGPLPDGTIIEVKQGGSA